MAQPTDTQHKPSPKISGGVNDIYLPEVPKMSGGNNNIYLREPSPVGGGANDILQKEIPGMPKIFMPLIFSVLYN